MDTRIGDCHLAFLKISKRAEDRFFAINFRNPIFCIILELFSAFFVQCGLITQKSRPFGGNAVDGLVYIVTEYTFLSQFRFQLIKLLSCIIQISFAIVELDSLLADLVSKAIKEVHKLIAVSVWVGVQPLIIIPFYLSLNICNVNVLAQLCEVHFETLI